MCAVCAVLVCHKRVWHVPWWSAGVGHRVFTHSYLGLGMDSAMQSASDLVMRLHGRQEDARRAAAEAAGGAGDATTALVAWDPCLPRG